MRNEGNQCWPIFFSRPYHGQADITKAHLRSATSTYSRPSMCHSHQTPGDIALLRSGTSSKAILSPLGTTSCPTYDCEATSPEKKTISSDSPPVAVTRCSELVTNCSVLRNGDRREGGSVTASII